MTQCNLKDMESMTEEEYLAQYKPSDYERPSVTVDMLIFTITRNQRLAMILIKRGGHPERGKWAIPGGFVEMDESLEDAAARRPVWIIYIWSNCIHLAMYTGIKEHGSFPWHIWHWFRLTHYNTHRGMMPRMPVCLR